MSAPKAPDPAKTAAAQADMNQNTAVTQYLLNATNQVTPQGKLTYSQSGQNFAPSANGQKYWYNPNTKEYRTSQPMTGGGATTQKVPIYRETNNGRKIVGYKDQTVNSAASADPSWQAVTGNLVPQYTATTEYSPEQQALYEQQTQLGSKLNNLALGQTDRLSGLLSQPIQMPDGTFTLGNEATESRLMELGRKRLDPVVAQRRSATETDMINRGVRPGTEAYRRAMEAQGQQENDAYNELLLSGRGQAAAESLQERQQRIQEAVLPRNQSINEISALMGGGQVSQPTFQQTPTPGVNGVDYTGLVNQKYQADAQASQSKMSGLLGLGTALGGWMFSDRRLKSAVKRIGTHKIGVGLYEYIINGMKQIGVMADEVLQVKPEAVRSRNGVYQVNYDMIGGI